ncbi:hypothetical protein SCLCIDRAFT_769332 [Scleroderma citrinum Foug A]|uniref:Uncharacterized protein n=1 Tax=Scleroderma citrinum Foug A TaxID=1036808 RepID=A0A0C3E556_9AGAM|nr:hypothetical protein SCLCIDRAFT_769332 [Scleroderma citrinum Foug A]
MARRAARKAGVVAMTKGVDVRSQFNNFFWLLTTGLIQAVRTGRPAHMTHSVALVSSNSSVSNRIRPNRNALNQVGIVLAVFF